MEKRNCQRNLQQARLNVQRRVGISIASATVLASIFAAGNSFAASSTWNGLGSSGGSNGTTPDDNVTPPSTYQSDTAWTNPLNWVGGVIPGGTSSPSNTDTATFGNTIFTSVPAGESNATNPVTTDQNRYIQNITFNGSSTQYAIGFNGTVPAGQPANFPLYLTDGGTVQVTSAVTSTTGSSAINDPVVLTGNSYTFDSESSAANGALKFNGTVTGSPTAASTTLYLTGVNYTTLNQTGSCTISGNIDNGAGPLDVVKNGIGTWTLTGTDNAFNSLTINSGAIRFNTNLGSMPAGGNIIINGGTNGAFTGGHLSISTASGTLASLTINAGGESPSSKPLTLTNTSGPALTLQLNYSGVTPPSGSSANSFILTGAVADEGGILVNGDSNYDSQVALGTTQTIDLGGVDRDFDIETVAGSSTPDLQVDGVISATPVAGVEGGLIKLGPGSMSVLAANTYTGQTQVSAGVFSISSTGSIASTTVGCGSTGRLNANGTANFGLSTSTALTSSGAVFLTSAATTLNTASLASITLQTGGAVTISDPTTHAGRTLLTVTGASGVTFGGGTNAWEGKLNLNGNDLIVKAAGALGLANITNQIKEGFSSGTSYWNGANGIVSSTASSNTNFLTALGSSSGGNPLDGVSTSTSDVLVKYTYYGDANLDGVVNGADYQQIDMGFGMHLTGWQNGDFNYDGVVDGSDYSLIDNTYNQINATGASALAITASPADVSAGVASVPEPTTLGLLGIAAVGLIGRRRRRNG